MIPLRLALALSLPLALPAPASAQSAAHLPGSAIDVQPIELELGGLGRGTMLLPTIQDGHLRLQLVDTRTEAVLQVEASVTPYYYYAAHPIAGAIEGGLYVPAPPESNSEPALIAAVDGEWATSSDGAGVLVLRFIQLSSEGPVIVGLAEGQFRVPPYAPVISTLAGGPDAGGAGFLALQPVETPSVIARRLAGGAIGVEPSREVIIIIDSIPPAPVSRVRIVWWLQA